MANPHRGEVKIKLVKPGNGVDEEEDLALRPTFEAIIEIEQELGAGFSEIMRRFGLVRDPLSFSMRDAVTILGIGLKAAGTPIGRTELNRRVYATGLNSLYPPLITYLANCWKGGKADEAEEDPTKTAEMSESIH